MNKVKLGTRIPESLDLEIERVSKHLRLKKQELIVQLLSHGLLVITNLESFSSSAKTSSRSLPVINTYPIVIQGRFVPRKPEYLHDGIFCEVTPEVFVDVSPATSRRNIRYRVTTAPGWICNFTVEFDKTIVTRSQMHSICIQAGEFVGLGDGRGIGLGRFTVKAFGSPDSS